MKTPKTLIVMYRQVLPIMVLVAYFITVVGCSKIVNVSLSELREPGGQRITSIELLDGTTIEYNRYGGAYDPNEKYISGIQLDGIRRVVNIAEIRFVTITTVVGDERSIVAIVPKLFVRQPVLGQARLRIVGLTTISGDVITFDDQTGNLDRTRQIVSGRLGGVALEVSFDSVLYIQTSVRDQDKSGFLTASIVLVGAVAALFIALAVDY